ncbi:farnesyl cysteine-carboxyl methyltransferase [Sphaerosporella brunnea]|uniref:Protein-S-isoprenylcysteine O-methyltransferase n=1 Tax=Sphaerosporella brunnea TaxID=1250544 RepID=A0A5J5EZK6_9PEZI|nr:farnesyl cysteine-carboxyl methyltransferase [Sphaerosporella brunnea]
MSAPASPASSEISDYGDSAHPTFARGQNPTSFPAYLYPSGAFALDGVASRAGGLGFVCALGLNAAWTFRSSYPQLPLFVAVLAFFHFMEFWITARYNTRRAKTDAFILTTNGAAYNIAHVSAMLEAVVEYYFCPELKRHGWVTATGVIMVVSGQLARTYAMKHAGSNFSHYVATRREARHRLVTTGIYAYLRHPSYFGYYWWAIGTQLMLGNPVCTVAFAGFLWMFFSTRIKHEERYLSAFFAEYKQYKARSWVGIPFIE